MSNSQKNNFSQIIELTNIKNVEDILTTLKSHEQTMIGTKLEYLVYFSRTYAVVNQNIYKARMDGAFKNPEAIDQLQMNFALLYFNTLNDYANTGSLPKQWNKAIQHRYFGFMPAGLSIFFAIKAHVMCDGLIALNSINLVPKILAEDYFSIDAIILRSSHEVVDCYNPNIWLKPVKEMGRRLAIKPICYIISKWRKYVWLRFSSYNTPEMEVAVNAQASDKLIPADYRVSDSDNNKEGS